MYIKTLSVSALNNYIKKVLDSDYILKNSCISGEISNFKLHSSGHLYFSLKDDFSKINCVMFRSSAQKVTFMPKNGMKVIIKGRVSSYEKEGNYQLYCEEMSLDGMGDLFIAFENLKEKLSKEGLFSELHKQRIPKYPRRIGVITSPTGAAIRDIINVATRRNKNVDILIYPALVQGINSSEDIIRGIRRLNDIEDIDVIILARGGGSIEELWSFNDEALAYEIFNSKKVIVTGVGHETDFTIADFASDFRAPTPSAAAEIVVPNISEVNYKINVLKSDLDKIILDKIRHENGKIDMMKKTIDLNSPMKYLSHQYNRIDMCMEMLNRKIKSTLHNENQKIKRLYSLLDAHNPLNVLSRGYSIVQDEKGSVIKNIDSLSKVTNVKIILEDGIIKARLEGKEVISNGKKEGNL